MFGYACVVVLLFVLVCSDLFAVCYVLCFVCLCLCVIVGVFFCVCSVCVMCVCCVRNNVGVFVCLLCAGVFVHGSAYVLVRCL